MTRHTRFVLAAMLAAGLAAASGTAGASAFGDQAAQFVRMITSNASGFKASEGPGSAQRVRAYVRNIVDIKGMGQFSLGPYWKKADDAQRARYLGAFENFVVKSFGARIGGLAGKPVQVDKVIEVKGSSDVIVMCSIKTKKRPIRVAWRIRPAGGRPKIVDIVFNGVSMITAQREDFTSVVRNNGGKVEALIALLEAKTQSASGRSTASN